MAPRGKYSAVLLCVGLFLSCPPSSLSSTSSTSSTSSSITTPTTATSPTTTPTTATTPTTTTPTTTTTSPTTTTPTTTTSTTPTTTPTTTSPTTTSPTTTTTTPTTTTTTPTTTTTTTTTSTTPTTPTATTSSVTSTPSQPTAPSGATADVSTAPPPPTVSAASTAGTTAGAGSSSSSNTASTNTSTSKASTKPEPTTVSISQSTKTSSSAAATSSPSSPSTDMSPPSSTTEQLPSSTTASPPSSTTASPPSSTAAPPPSSTAAPTSTVTTGAPEEYPDVPVNKESFFELTIGFSYTTNSDAKTIVANLTQVFESTPGFRRVLVNKPPNRVKRDTTPTDSFTVSFDADVIQNNTEFDSAIRQSVVTLKAFITFDNNINNTIDEFLATKSDICKAEFVCGTAYECRGGMCQYRCKNKCTGTQVCSIVVNSTMTTTKCSQTTGPATQAPSTASNDDDRLIQVAVPLAVVLFLFILALIYACHKLHRQKNDSSGKSYDMEHL